MPKECTHLDQIKVKQTTKHVCEECVKTGRLLGAFADVPNVRQGRML